mmetsp:Transcript_113487/g.317016  ORF Transcript_113487/g.317016 Transcript_113487/m.317016 type:complete len:282 (-) Transcript_113487:57-902(-)
MPSTPMTLIALASCAKTMDPAPRDAVSDACDAAPQEPYLGFTMLRRGAPPTGERPKSAAYVARRCREVVPGSGGSPLPAASLRQRPLSARQGAPKTERWREAGEMRWPVPPTPKRSTGEAAEPVPFHQTTDYSQGSWKNELWMRSLRQPGLLIQDPLYAGNGATLKDMHEEWRECPPVSPRCVPYCGGTSSGPVVVKSDAPMVEWVERPVSTGRYALAHMDGGRYKFDGTPRFYMDVRSPHYVGPEEKPRRHATPSSARPRSGTRGPLTPSERWKARLCHR